MQVCPFALSQPVQPPNVDAFGVAVNVTLVPAAKLALQVAAQPKPPGELDTVPAPVPAKFTVRRWPVPLKQTTVAVIVPVTIAPDEDMFPMLLSVWTVAEIRELPQATPVAVSRPLVASTVAISGVFEVQTT